MTKLFKILAVCLLLGGIVFYGYWSASRNEKAQRTSEPSPTPQVNSRFTDYLPVPSTAPVASSNPTVNFAQTGNLVKSGKFDWLLVYEKMDSAKNRIKLTITDKSLCQKEVFTDYCVYLDYANGDLVKIEGREKDGVVTVVKMWLLNENTTNIANPASVYCAEQGGTSEIVTQKDGSQTGICRISKTKVCDEWEYYRTGVCK